MFLPIKKREWRSPAATSTTLESPKTCTISGVDCTFTLSCVEEIVSSESAHLSTDALCADELPSASLEMRHEQKCFKVSIVPDGVFEGKPSWPSLFQPQTYASPHSPTAKRRLKIFLKTQCVNKYRFVSDLFPNNRIV